MAQLRKAQVWVLDLFFGLLVFVLALSIFFQSEVNLSDSEERQFDDMLFESKLVSDSLLSAGYPRDWSLANVSEIGITKDYRINTTKLEQMRQMNYSQTKTRLRTKYDYYFFFEGVTGIQKVSSSQEGIGKPGVNSTNIISQENPSDLVKVNRFVIFRLQPTKLVVYLWR